MGEGARTPGPRRRDADADHRSGRRLARPRGVPFRVALSRSGRGPDALRGRGAGASHRDGTRHADVVVPVPAPHTGAFRELQVHRARPDRVRAVRQAAWVGLPPGGPRAQPEDAYQAATPARHRPDGSRLRGADRTLIRCRAAGECACARAVQHVDVVAGR